jgi:hypothetical protein
MELDELLTHMRAGALQEHRTQNLELKETWTRSHGEKLSALGNRTDAEPKWFCLGVRDDGSLCGHGEKWVRSTEQVLSQHLNAYLDPVQACKKLSCHQVESSWVIVIELMNPGAVVKWDRSAYKSAGTTIQEMTPAEGVVTSNLLRRWLTTGVVERIRKGLYRFRPRGIPQNVMEKMIQVLSEQHESGK